MTLEDLPQEIPHFVSFIQSNLSLEGRLSNSMMLGIRTYQPDANPKIKKNPFGPLQLFKHHFPLYVTTGVFEDTALKRLDQYKELLLNDIHSKHLDAEVPDIDKAVWIESDSEFPARLYTPLFSREVIEKVFPQAHIIPRAQQVRAQFGGRYATIARFENEILPLLQKVKGFDFTRSRILSDDIEVTDYGLPDLSDIEKKLGKKQLQQIYEELCETLSLEAERLSKDELLFDIRKLRNGGRIETLASISFGDSDIVDANNDVIPLYFSRLDSRDFLIQALVHERRADPVILMHQNGLVYDNNKLDTLEHVGFGIYRTRFMSATRGGSLQNYVQVGLEELDTCGFARNYIPCLLNYRLSTISSAVLNKPVTKSLSHQELEFHLQRAIAGNLESKKIVDSYATGDIRITHPMGMKLLPFAANLAVATDNSFARISSSARSTIAFDYHVKRFEAQKRRSFFMRKMRMQVLTPQGKLALPELPSEFDAKDYVRSFVSIKKEMQFGEFHLIQTAPFYRATISMFAQQRNFKELINFVKEDNTILNKGMSLEFFDALGELPVLAAFRYSDWYVDPNLDKPGSIIHKLVAARKAEKQKNKSSHCSYASIFCLPVGHSPKNVLRKFGESLSELNDLAFKHNAVAYDGRFMLLRSKPDVLPPGTQYVGTGPFVIYDESSYIGRTGFAVRKSGIFDFTSGRCELSKYEKEIFSKVYDTLFSSGNREQAIHSALCILYDGALKVQSQCLENTVGDKFDDAVDLALRRNLTRNASEYTSNLRWVVAAKAADLKRGEEVVYRMTPREQLAEIIGLPQYADKKIKTTKVLVQEKGKPTQSSLMGLDDAFNTTRQIEIPQFNQDATFYRLAKAISGHTDRFLLDFFSKTKSHDEIRAYVPRVREQLVL